LLQEEQIVRDVLAMWRAGLEETKESWRRYAAGHLVWWNSARGTIVGLEPCLDGIEQLYRLLEVAYVDVPVRNVLAERGRVIVERSDNLFRKDGSVVAYVPVTGVIEFEGERIVRWRDYCDDWILKLQSGGEITPPTAP
jgi:limonene-1,2-epoxide hydrolase